MNLLMLNYEFPPIGGGAAKAHQCLLRQYSGKDNLHVEVLTSAPQPGLVTEQFGENITIHRVGVHKNDLHFWRRSEVIEWLWKAGSHCRRLLRQNRYDLVHAFFGFPTGWLCFRNARKVPYVISLRGSDVPGQHARFQLEYKLLAPVFRAIWKNAAALVACSGGLKSRALSFMPSASIDVIPNGVELDRFRPADSDQKADVLRLLTVGRLSVTKRVEILIDAVEVLHRQGRKLHFTIAGGGALEPQLKAAILERNLGGAVEMTGRTDAEEMPQLYRQNDMFISASMQEGMSNAMLEAMASGLPIVTTRCEGLDELIADNGLIVEPANAESIATAITKLADDRALCRQMSLAARRRAEQFSWSRVAGQYLALYERLI